MIRKTLIQNRTTRLEIKFINLLQIRKVKIPSSITRAILSFSWTFRMKFYYWKTCSMNGAAHWPRFQISASCLLKESKLKEISLESKFFLKKFPRGLAL